MADIKGTQIDLENMTSDDSSNLLQKTGTGLFMALRAADNVATQYVSSSTGSDTNTGTRTSPLQSIGYALSRIPANTSATIYLFEEDTFPWRHIDAPSTWGASINYFGKIMGTGNSTITIAGYGPDHDRFGVLAQRITNFGGWQTAAMKRPTIEIGHYLYNGKPVFTSIVLGSTAGAIGIIRGVEIVLTAQARAAAIAAGGMTSQAYRELVVVIRGQLLGTILPKSIVASNNSILTYAVGVYDTLRLWQLYIEDTVIKWLRINSTAFIDISNTGNTTTDNEGTAWPTLTNNVTVNLPDRIDGVVKDSNGTPRNARSSYAL